MAATLTMTDYRILFAKWKADHGVEARGRRTGNVFMAVPTDPSARVAMYIVLIDTLVSKGYDRDDFGEFLIGKIVETSVPPEYDDKKALSRWKHAAEEDFYKALATVFEDDLIIKERQKREKVIVQFEEPTPPPVAEDLDPEKMSKITGIALPNAVDDEEFLKLLEGPADE